MLKYCPNSIVLVVCSIGANHCGRLNNTCLIEMELQVERFLDCLPIEALDDSCHQHMWLDGILFITKRGSYRTK